MKTKKILVTGASGGLAGYLIPALNLSGFTVMGVARKNGINVDKVTDDNWKSNLEQIFKSYCPDIVINLVAMTNVDKCQMYPEKALLANAMMSVDLASLIQNHSPTCLFVQISSDQVYSGKGPHSEIDASPINTYGWSKLFGEMPVAGVEKHLIIRLNYIGFGSTKKQGFLGWLKSVIDGNRNFQLADDVYFNPLSGFDAGRLISQVIDLGITGTFNFGCQLPGVTKKQLVVALAHKAEFNLALAKTASVKDLGLIAERPLDMTMNISSISKFLPMPSFDETVDQISLDWQEA